MRKIVLALMLVGGSLAVATTSAGCKHPGSAKLEGRWRGTRAEGVSPQVQDAANNFAMQTEILSRGNLITITTPGAKGQQAPYVVDDEKGPIVVLHTEKDGAANKETFQFADDGKTMTWRLGEGRSILFQKVNP